ncbi:M15 family metallopeptidase [Pseudoalteromonas aurantia]|uniref:D-alanyl-D-alanine carboxypeptidase-like core domain-containing protein n=1 Tax=Pseudoalteromonas aurantia 208 TaxID=1314867 RepID=A0ABR9E9Q3_9GAMM|nr:M15 family metallopeptidase [Pseudoalteromonas aurantia]MBE0367721.1 hypothetical protein [Pseudoalteromonas aurantia 208]
MMDEHLASIACGLTQTHLCEYQGQLLHRDIIDDLVCLTQHAKDAGFTLSIASGYRNFERQMLIWNSKFLGKRAVLNKQNAPVNLTGFDDLEKCHAIMLFSALPGGSRHHFGTDLDIYAINSLPDNQKLQLEPWEYAKGGPFYDFNCWLDSNLAKFGFYRPYARFNGGVAAEPWHISHIKTSSYISQAQNVDNLQSAIQLFDVAGKQTILANISQLHSQYINNTCSP